MEDRLPLQSPIWTSQDRAEIAILLMGVRSGAGGDEPRVALLGMVSRRMLGVIQGVIRQTRGMGRLPSPDWVAALATAHADFTWLVGQAVGDG